MIRLIDLSKVYRTAYMETTALDRVCIHIGKGEFIAVMGPSGCGKSTLLNVVGMIDSPSLGEYWFDGEEIGSRSENELVDLPLLYMGLSKKERRAKVDKALELVGLESRAKYKPQQLSGGQQQRLAVARSVVGEPKLILADEPTGNLDTKNGNEVMNMLGVLKDKGVTILMVTHSPEHGKRADRIINMLDGEVVDGGGAPLSVVSNNSAQDQAEL